MDSFWFDPNLYAGRPAENAGRLAREIACYDLLEQLGIPFFRVDHDPAMTIPDCEHIDALLGVAMCKNLFLCNTQKTNFYLLMMPGDKPFKTKNLSKQIGSARLSFADAEHMGEFLGVLPGAVTVLGLAHDREKRVRLLIDADVLKSEFIGCHPLVNTSSVRISTADLLNKFLPFAGHVPTTVEL